MHVGLLVAGDEIGSIYDPPSVEPFIIAHIVWPDNGAVIVKMVSTTGEKWWCGVDAYIPFVRDHHWHGPASFEV